MASYPGSIPNFAESSPANLGDADSTGRTHSQRHDVVEAELEAALTALGVTPQGGSATVAARIAALESNTLAPSEVLAGTNVTVDTSTTPGSVIINATSGSGGGFQVADTGVRYLNEFAGASADDKLTAALSYMAASTYKPTLVMPHGRTDFSQSRTMFTGLKIVGAGGGATVELPRTNNPYSSFIKFNGTSVNNPWWQATGNVFGVHFSNLAIEGNANSTIFSTSTSGNVWTSNFMDLGMSLMAHAFGDPTSAFIVTGSNFGGTWHVNNPQGEYALRFKGADSRFWNDGNLYIDYGGAGNYNVGKYSIWWDWVVKSQVSGIFITAEAEVSGMRIDGPSQSSSSQPGYLVFDGIRVEGRNEAAASYGPVIWMTGGRVLITGGWISYGMKDPANANYSAGGKGVIHQTGGYLKLTDCAYGRAAAATSDVPWLYATGSATSTFIRGTSTSLASTANTFTGKPRYLAENSATVVTDHTMQTQDAAGARSCVPQVINLPVGASVPAGTPAGTLIVRT